MTRGVCSVARLSSVRLGNVLVKKRRDLRGVCVAPAAGSVCACWRTDVGRCCEQCTGHS
jgi:hypothetical protein